MEKILLFNNDMSSDLYGLQSYKLAMKNTNYNSDGKATILYDDEWNDESEWDDMFEQMKKQMKKEKNKC